MAERNVRETEQPPNYSHAQFTSKYLASLGNLAHCQRLFENEVLHFTLVVHVWSHGSSLFSDFIGFYAKIQLLAMIQLQCCCILKQYLVSGFYAWRIWAFASSKTLRPLACWLTFVYRLFYVNFGNIPAFLLATVGPFFYIRN